ncbi:Rieske 2Fe-2S domain-containing protein [Luteolibacter ambystomatis]|uniref:Rieske 2Fe-2S domain-containing protein n=1 Tax=Luteolibacter ambystomatis TaxID=2824561 RepID=A0A975IZB8_9BACT|nr:Rieske 2Fe-2S domain-containing protein [Luteolibacter ambystomatis]QUE49530.1 Rieske 2Fe-2S domain-containing protein [Luteolibacter ambystomatis]
MDSVSSNSRRVMLKRFILGSVSSMVAPAWVGRVLAEVSEPMAGPAQIRLKLVDFPVLQAAGGSVQVEFSQISKPFTLNRVSAAEFVALDSRCTHAGCTVGKYVVADGRMRCPCHGSRYDIRGRVFRDAEGNSTEPAPRDIERFASSYDPVTQMVAITIPGLGFGIRSISVQPPGRMKLRFSASAFSKYEILYSETLNGTFTRVSFATTPTGAANQTSIQTTADGIVPLEVYVDASGPKGFYVVSLVLKEV